MYACFKIEGAGMIMGKSILVLGKTATKNSEWEQGKVSLIFAIPFHIESDRRGGWPDLFLTEFFLKSSLGLQGEAD